MERVLQAALYLGERFFPSLSREQLKASLLAGALIAFGSLYCLTHWWLGELHLTHIIFTAVILGFYFSHVKTRIFILLAIPFLMQNIIYDGLRYIPFEWIQPIHVAEPYQIEKALLGITDQGTALLVNEYLLRHAHAAFDFLFGIVYHLLDPVSIAMILILWKLKSTAHAQRYAVAFLLMNLFAFATYLFYPAAAPWYVAQYGFLQPLGPVPGNAAGLANFDGLIKQDVSGSFYGMNPFVFGAIPSMHAGFTMLVWLYSFFLKKRWVFLFGLFAMLTWVAALYLQHHYIIDLIIGNGYALVAFWLIEQPFRRPVAAGYGLLSKILIDQGPKTLLGR